MKIIGHTDFIAQCGEPIVLKVYTELKEMPMLRYKEFRERVIRAFEDADVPTIDAYHAKMMDAFNSRELVKPILVHENYVRATKRSQVNSLDIAFSMMSITEDEDPMNISEEYHREKMDKIIKSGIRAQVFAREVYFFMSKHIVEFRGYGEIIQMLFEMSNPANSQEP